MENLEVQQKELEEVTGTREVWQSLLRLLPLGPDCRQEAKDRWMDGQRTQPWYWNQ